MNRRAVIAGSIIQAREGLNSDKLGLVPICNLRRCSRRTLADSCRPRVISIDLHLGSPVARIALDQRLPRVVLLSQLKTIDLPLISLADAADNDLASLCADMSLQCHIKVDHYNEV